MAGKKIPTAEDMPEVPAAGQDPDTRQRLAKTLVASGIPADDLPDGLSVDPITDEDRQEHRDMVQAHRDAAQRRAEAADKAAADAQAKADAGTASTAAAEAREAASTAPPQGRSTTPAKATTAKTE